MEGRLVFKDCAVFSSEGAVGPRVALVVEGNRVARLGPDAAIPALPGDWVIDGRGRLLSRGLRDGYGRLVGAQAERAGIDERLLTPTEVEPIAALAMARAVLSGVTGAVDQLFGRAAVGERLSAEARAAGRIGLRLSNSSAIDPKAEDQGRSQLLESVGYADAIPADGLVRGSIGLCPEDASDRLLEEVASRRRALGCELHVFLGRIDRSTPAVLGRLKSNGLLGPFATVAWEGELDPKGWNALDQTGASAASAPSRGGPEGKRRSSQLATFGKLPAAYALYLGGIAHFGTPREGELADLVLYDWVGEEGRPAEPDWIQHSQVAWTVVDGRVVVREGQLVGQDWIELSKDASMALGSARNRR